VHEVQVVENGVDHPASLKLKLIANRIPTTLDHARSRHLSPIVGGGMGDGSSRHRFQQQPARPGELLWGAVVGASGPGASPCPCVGAPSWARADQEPPPARAWGAPSWARADQEPPPARAWSPLTPTTAPSEAPSPGETPRDPKQPCDPNTAMKVGARSAPTCTREIARSTREIRSSVDLGGGGGGGGAVPRARLLIRAQL
jgi:hypothetical protein